MNLHVSRVGFSVGMALFLSACTVTRQRQMLTMFFDGRPSGTPAAVTLPAAEPTPRVETRLPDLYLAARKPPPGLRHQPSAERPYASCHDRHGGRNPLFLSANRSDPTAALLPRGSRG